VSEPEDTWDDIAEWWIAAVRDDPAQSDTHRLAAELLQGTAGKAIDLGCGEGQGLRLVDGNAIGVDLSHRLLTAAHSFGPVVLARLPELSWVRSESFDRALSVGLVDMIADHDTFFAETARVVRGGGHLVMVINHPLATAPESEPVVDVTGGALWRWGTYLNRGSMRQEVETRVVDLHHRPLGTLLTSAAEAGWVLESVREAGPSAAAIEADPGLAGYEQMPVMLGARWRRAQ
jgi:SAM-dependent methyltransferase